MENVMHHHHYGALPTNLGYFDFKPIEVFYFLYLPISLPGQMGFTMPKSLHPFNQMIEAIQKDEPERFEAEHVYVTAKRQFVGPEITANRPGWHSDGFGTNDLNYIWYDALPTIFNTGPFVNIPDDDLAALDQFALQCHEINSVSYNPGALLKLTPANIHRVALVPAGVRQFMRTFIKVSVSEHQYNLDGNSINHELDYFWKRYSREEARNSPHSAGKDFVFEPHKPPRHVEREEGDPERLPV